MLDIFCLSRLRRSVVLAIVIAMAAFYSAAEINGQDTEEVVVLKNGGIFVGKVSEREQSLIVQLPRGGEVRLNPATVDFRAPSIKDVYAVLVRRSTPGDAKQNLGLFDWCISQSLLREADIQLESAARNGADPSALQRRRRHLEALFDAERQKLLNAMQQPAMPRDSELNSPPPGPATEKQEAPRPFSPSQPATNIETLEGTDSSRSAPTSNESRRDFEFSEEVFVAFRREIQPRLIHGCAASSCHGPSAQGGFELARVARGRPITKGMTEKNLKSVMHLINPKSPHSSPLLRIVTELHAGQSVPIIARHETEHFQRLENWVVYTGESMRTQMDESHEPRRFRQGHSEVVASIPKLGVGTTTGPSEGEANMDSRVRTTGFTEELDSNQRVEQATDRPANSTMSSHESGLAKPPFRPVDAFDPEIFNRYAKGELTSQVTPEPLKIIPIPEDPIGSPTSQITPPSRAKTPEDNPDRN